MPARNEASGQYTETYTTAEFLRALRQLEGEVGTKAVEQVVGCKYRTAIAKLHELEEDSEITSRRVGNAYLWRIDEASKDERIPEDDDSAQHQAEPSGGGNEEDLPESDPYYPGDEWD